jgi:hypothetical protein
MIILLTISGTILAEGNKLHYDGDRLLIGDKIFSDLLTDNLRFNIDGICVACRALI